jgi:succinate dehydrogenase / fumarate reductase membrane anchor subunit
LKGALSGLRAWLVQRFTAVYMLLFLLLALAFFAFNTPQSYAEWHQWIANPLVAVPTALFFIALLLHTWVGLRDVMMDYVKPLPLRVALLASLGFFLGGLALWVLRILLLVQR